MIDEISFWKCQKRVAIRRKRFDLIELIEEELINLYLEKNIYTTSP
jgi:hypothetical protein